LHQISSDAHDLVLLASAFHIAHGPTEAVTTGCWLIPPKRAKPAARALLMLQSQIRCGGR